MLKRTIIFLSLLPSFCFAQKDLPGMSLDVVTDYKPLLADAVKIDVSPKLIPADSSKNIPAYMLQPSLLNLPFVPADIRPVAMVKELPEITQNNYLKAGFGTQWSPYISLNLNTGVSEKRDAGLYAAHHGGSGSLDYQKFSDNTIQAYYKKFFKKNALTLKTGYDGTIRYFYGYDHNTLMDFVKKEMKQTFQEVNTSVEFANTKLTKTDWNYNFKTNYTYYWNRTGGNEWNLAPELLMSKTINKIHNGSLFIGTDFTQFNEDSVSAFNTTIHIKPMYSIIQNKWSLRTGLDIAPTTNDGSTSVYFLPDIEARYNLIGEYIVPFAGIKGEINKNNFKNLSTENPFINDILPVVYSSLFDIHAGIKGSIGNHFSFLFRVADQVVDHLALYNPDTNYITRYNVSYAEDANVFNVHGELGYKESERLNILCTADYFSYTLDFNDLAYGKPTYKISMKAEYNIQKKILINASVYMMSKTPYQIMVDSVSVSGFNKSYFDFNLGLIYNYKKNFGAFLQFNNITATVYNQWYNYNGYGFGLMGGLLLKF